MTEEKISTSTEISLDEVAVKLKALFRYLISKWLVIITITIVGAIVGIIYAWVQTPKYAAILSFSMEDEKSSGGSLAGLAAQFGIDVGAGGTVFSGENIVVLLESDRIAKVTLLSNVNVNGKEKSLLNLFLDVFEWQKGFTKSADTALRNLRYPENQDPATFTRLQDSVLKLVMKKIRKDILKVDKPEQKLNYYTITCTTPDETFSTEYSKQLIKQASDFYVATKTKRSARVVDILQKRSDSLHGAYNAALTGRAELSDANINPAFQLPVVGIQSKQTDLTVLGTAYGELLKNLELAKFNLLKETPLIQVVDEPAEPLEKIKLSRLLAGLICGFAFGFICVVYLSIKKLNKK